MPNVKVRVTSAKGSLGRKSFPTTASIRDVLDFITVSKKVTPDSTTIWLIDARTRKQLRQVLIQQSLGSIGYSTMEHMLFVGKFKGQLNSATSTVETGRTVVKPDGSVTRESSYKEGEKMKLSSIKKAWRIDEFIAREAQFEFHFGKHPKAQSKLVKLDNTASNIFQQYAANSQFKTPRIGFLYGRLVTDNNDDSVKTKGKSTTTKPKTSKKKKMSLKDLETDEYKKKADKRPTVIVETIYEPLQTVSKDSKFVDILEDPRLENIEKVAKCLGLSRVGLIFTHPPGRDYEFSGAEIVTLAQETILGMDSCGISFEDEMKREKDKGVRRPFIIAKFFLNEKGQPSCETFELTAQVLEIVAENALEAVKEPRMSKVKEPFKAIVEAKQAKFNCVDNDFFIVRVPIQSYDSSYAGPFPRLNRDVNPDVSAQKYKQALRSLLERDCKTGIPLDKLKDFHLLSFLTDVLGTDDVLSIGKNLRKFVERRRNNRAMSREKATAEEKYVADGYAMLLKNYVGIFD